MIEISIKAKDGTYKLWTVKISDTSSQYGTNVTMHPKQTDEQIKAKAKPENCHYGKVFWTDGKISVAQKPEPKPAPEDSFVPQQAPDAPWENGITIEDEDDLPF